MMGKGVILIGHVDGAVGNRVDLRIPGERHEELISHGQPLVVRYELTESAILERL